MKPKLVSKSQPNQLFIAGLWHDSICAFILSCKSQGSSKEPQDNDNMAAHGFPLKKMGKKIKEFDFQQHKHPVIHYSDLSIMVIKIAPFSLHKQKLQTIKDYYATAISIHLRPVSFSCCFLHGRFHFSANEYQLCRQ